MNIKDLLDPAALTTAINTGHISVRHHPGRSGLSILNYTEKAQFDRHWTTETLTCRGLIIDHAGEVLARPFPKFFNHDEPEAATLPAGLVRVTDKLDGSLGILYHDGDDWAIATRGSFDSVQARHATHLYRAQYAGRWEPRPGLTYLFEIIYPANRIVVDYGDTDDLFLLGAVRNRDGAATGPKQCPEWPGPRTAVFDYPSLEAALAAPPRENAEGYVIQFLGHDLRVKVKQDDYKRLHAIITGWNERTIWELLKTGRAAELAGLPDEFHAWARTVTNQLSHQHYDLWCDVQMCHAAVLDNLPTDHTPRKDYALAVKDHPLRPAMFLALDGHTQRLHTWLWDQIRPTAVKEPTLV